MKRIAKGLAWSLGGLLLAAFALYGWVRWRPPSPERAEALALLASASTLPSGHNAFERQWFRDFDMPEVRVADAFRGERERIEAWLKQPRGYGDAEQQTVTEPQAQATFARLPAIDPKARERMLCASSAMDTCLAKMAAIGDEVDAFLAQHRVRLTNEMSLADDDVFVSPWVGFISVSAFSDGRLWLTSAARDFAAGRPTAALESACSQVVTWRRFHAHAHNLIERMLFGSFMARSAVLVSRMVEALPADVSVPSRCDRAFAPIATDEVDLCPTMSGEYAFMTQAIDIEVARNRYERLFPRDVAYRPAGQALVGFCAPAVSQVLMSDGRLDTPAPPSVDVFDRLARPWSHEPQAMAEQMASLASYAHRDADAVATLRMTATLLWLRSHPASGQALQERMDRLPTWMKVNEARHLRISDDGFALVIDAYGMPVWWPAAWSVREVAQAGMAEGVSRRP